MKERSLEFEFIYPVNREPEWKTQVDRWYQLDAPAYGLAEFYQQNRAQLLHFPDLIILASPAASNATDHQFVNLGAQSPAKFVHTLPNIRISPLCQVMNWSGPVLCFQNGKEVFESAKTEARYLLGPKYTKIWVLSVKDFKVSAFIIEKNE